MSSDDALRRSIINSSLMEARRPRPRPAGRREHSLLDAAALVVGGLLTAEGIHCRRGWLPMGLGIAVMYQGLCGLNGRECGLDFQDTEQPDDKIASNPVDEAVWESFPASDPPTFTGQIT